MASQKNLEPIFQKISSIDWLHGHDFFIYLSPNSNNMKLTMGWNDSTTQERILESVKSIDIPQLQRSPVEDIINQQWFQGSQVPEILSSTINFIERDSGYFYRMFSKAFQASAARYPDEVAFTIAIFVINGNGEQKLIARTENAMINSVGQIQFSHEGSDFIEFGVEFRFPIMDFIAISAEVGDLKVSEFRRLTQTSKNISISDITKYLNGALSSFGNSALSNAKTWAQNKIKSIFN